MFAGKGYEQVGTAAVDVDDLEITTAMPAESLLKDAFPLGEPVTPVTAAKILSDDDLSSCMILARKLVAMNTIMAAQKQIAKALTWRYELWRNPLQGISSCSGLAE